LATYVVGDIQGCYQPLQRVLAEVDFHSGRDQLWSVGDLVNRGPHSLETLRFLHGLGSAFTGVLGNHDLHFLAVHFQAKTDGKTRSLQPLLTAPDCAQLAGWVRQLPLAFGQSVATDAGLRKVLLVHAGMAPGWDAASALILAEEVTSVLRGKKYLQLLKGMYGDLPDRWHPTLAGIDRLRVITNVLTRMRFCTAAGQLEFNVKSEADSAPPGFKPWFDFLQLPPEELLLFGHWATLNGITNRDNIIGLDTGCVWGRCLTLLHLEKHERVSVTCHDCQ
jgi:bis(5'-nucleosyl)-tetraphosphatase (symmetrical)